MTNHTYMGGASQLNNTVTNSLDGVGVPVVLIGVALLLGIAVVGWLKAVPWGRLERFVGWIAKVLENAIIGFGFCVPLTAVAYLLYLVGSVVHGDPWASVKVVGKFVGVVGGLALVGKVVRVVFGRLEESYAEFREEIEDE